MKPMVDDFENTQKIRERAKFFFVVDYLELELRANEFVVVVFVLGGSGGGSYNNRYAYMFSANKVFLFSSTSVIAVLEREKNENN